MAEFQTRLLSLQTPAGSLGFQTTCSSDQLATNSGNPARLSGVIIHEDFPEFKKFLYL
jgi:hypothetical protein